ncbi:hypothetical protein FKM82_015268 [Ascaphus truei]
MVEVGAYLLAHSRSESPPMLLGRTGLVSGVHHSCLSLGTQRLHLTQAPDVWRQTPTVETVTSSHRKITL